MKLVIGGYAGGKLNVVLRNLREGSSVVFDAGLPAKEQLQEVTPDTTIVINHFHLWVKDCMTKGRSPEEEIDYFLSDGRRLIIISDEIGNGIVPIDAFEREYRERLGRILINIADKADEVVRVICGIEQKIK